MVYLCNEKNQEYTSLEDLLFNNNFININKLQLKIPGWKKSDKMFLSLSLNSFPNMFKKIEIKDFDKRRLDILEDSLVNVYKKLFNICLNEIKELKNEKHDFEVI
jgi:hypothetical protein